MYVVDCMCLYYLDLDVEIIFMVMEFEDCIV